jgi:hypothetical protein
MRKAANAGIRAKRALGKDAPGSKSISRGLGKMAARIYLNNRIKENCIIVLEVD